VSGLAGVNVALQGSSFGLKQTASPRRLTLSGVVSDPRGVALPGAALTANTTSGVINSVGDGTTLDRPSSASLSALLRAGADGFFVFYVGDGNAATTGDEALGDAQVNLDVTGKTAGGLEVELADSAAVQFSGGASIKTANLQCLTFPAAPAPTIVTDVDRRGDKLIPGEIATIRVADNLSERADEFFIRIHTSGGRDNPGNRVFDVLPLQVIKSEGSAARQVVFRVPLGLGDGTAVGTGASLTTYNAKLQICQLGLVPPAIPASNATSGDPNLPKEADEGAGLGALSDEISAYGFGRADYLAAIVGELDGKADSDWQTSAAAAGSRYVRHLEINPGIIVAPNELATVSVALENRDTDVPVEVEVSFNLSSDLTLTGAVFGGAAESEAFITAGVYPELAAGAINASSIASSTAEVTGFRKWTVKGLLLPENADDVAIGSAADTKDRRLDLGLKVADAAATARTSTAATVELKDVKVTYPTRGFEETLTGAASRPFYSSLIAKNTATGSNSANGYTISKSYVDISNSTLGAVDVELTITPPANAAFQALKLIDITPVELAPVKASLTAGSAFTSLSITGSDQTFLVNDGSNSYTVTLRAGSYGTLTSLINGLLLQSGSPFQFSESDGKVKLEATGGASTLSVSAGTGSLANDLKLLSSSSPQPVSVTAAGRYTVDALRAGQGVAFTGSGTMSGGETWTSALLTNLGSLTLKDGQDGNGLGADIVSFGTAGFKHFTTSTNPKNLMAVALTIVPPNTRSAAPIKVRYKLNSTGSAAVKAGTKTGSGSGDVSGSSVTRILESYFKGSAFDNSSISETNAPIFIAPTDGNSGIRETNAS
jgi:hypothetical protein